VKVELGKKIVKRKNLVVVCMKVVRVVVGMITHLNVLRISKVVIDTPVSQNVMLMLQKCVDGGRMLDMIPEEEIQGVIQMQDGRILI
jgi:hypothetical protein